MGSYNPYYLPVLRTAIGKKFLNVGYCGLGTGYAQFAFRVNKVILLNSTINTNTIFFISELILYNMICK